MVDHTLSVDYPYVYQLNVELLTLARAEQWDVFSQKAEVYIATLQTMLARYDHELNTDEKEEVKTKLRALLLNENEMAEMLKTRLEVLKVDMSSLGRGTRCHQAYSDVFSAAASRF